MSTPAGWYPDPKDAASLRYWDGQGWTEHKPPRWRQPHLNPCRHPCSRISKRHSRALDVAVILRAPRLQVGADRSKPTDKDRRPSRAGSRTGPLGANLDPSD